MEHNLKIILEEYEKYKGQFIITDWQWQIHRFIGIGDDGTDWYYCNATPDVSLNGSPTVSPTIADL